MTSSRALRVPDAAVRRSGGHGPEPILSRGANGCHAIPRLHLLVSIDKKMIEILDANEAEPRILHVRNRVEGNRESGGENQHMDPASRRGGRHAEACE